jgi:hypothetical protein
VAETRVRGTLQRSSVCSVVEQTVFNNPLVSKIAKDVHGVDYFVLSCAILCYYILARSRKVPN